MEQGLKERLVGAAVIVIVAVIFIPMLLDNSEDREVVITRTNIPPKPETIPEPPQENEFSSRIVPLKKEAPATGVVKTEPEIPPPEPEPAPVAVEDKTEAPVSEVTGKGQTSTAAVIENEEPVTNVGLSAWVVQLGSFSSQENAEKLNRQLRDAGFRSFVEPLKQNNTVSYRVRVGPELKRSDAEAINTKIKTAMKLDGIVVHYP